MQPEMCFFYRLDVGGCVQPGLCFAGLPCCFFPILPPWAALELFGSHPFVSPDSPCLSLRCCLTLGGSGMGDFGSYVFYLPL